MASRETFRRFPLIEARTGRGRCIAAGMGAGECQLAPTWQGLVEGVWAEGDASTQRPGIISAHIGSQDGKSFIRHLYLSTDYSAVLASPEWRGLSVFEYPTQAP